MTNLRTRIEWTTATWNPWTGCSKVSPGCKYCYAERLSRRGVGFDVKLWPSRWTHPLAWKTSKLIFVNSMSDFWHPAVPDEARLEVLEVMQKASHHVYQILTKRPEDMLRFFRQHPSLFSRNHRHLWLGVSVELAQFVDRIAMLVEVPAAVHFVSFEPLLGPIDGWPVEDVEWVIVGGEFGPQLLDPKVCEARALVYRDGDKWLPKPEAVAWVRAIRDRALAHGVKFFFKQWGGPTPKSGGRLLDGREWSEMPEAPRQASLSDYCRDG